MIALIDSLLPDIAASPERFLLLGGLSVMLFGMAKGGFGGSIGLLSTPLMIEACGPGRTQLAVAILLPLLIAADQFALASWWRKWRLDVVKLLLPGAVAGIAAGGLVLAGLGRINDSGSNAASGILRLGIGGICLIFVAIQSWRFLRRRPPRFRPVPWQGACFGAATGLTSTLAHAGGPITAMYLLPQGLSKGDYVASTALYYWINNLLKVPVFIWAGQLDFQAAGAGVLLLPAVALGVLAGRLLHNRVSQKHFTGVVYVLLALAGARLLWRGAAALTGG